MEKIISRNEIMRLIHSDMWGIMEPRLSELDVLRILDYTPAVDAVHIVRCKDCTHKPIRSIFHSAEAPTKHDGTEDYICPYLNEEDAYYNFMPKDDFYCAYGERSTK